MKVHHVSVAKDYSRTPGPRYKSQGSFSGEGFRDMLEVWLQRGEEIVVDLDGTAGFGSSFIEEAFGGLVRRSVVLGFSKDEIIHRISFRSSDLSYKIEAEEAMTQAQPEQVHS